MCVGCTAIDNGEAPFSALFENLGGYVSAFELVDTAGIGGSTTTVGVRFENSDGDLANAERLVFDLGGIRLEFDGSFPRDVHPGWHETFGISDERIDDTQEVGDKVQV